jgi:hypothetical protein
MTQQETYINDLLQRRLRRHGLKPTEQQFNDLFRDFIGYWREAEAEAYSPRKSKLWLLNALDSYLLGQVAKRNDK